MFCPKCGNKVSEGAVFCPECGNEVSTSQNNAANHIPSTTSDTDSSKKWETLKSNNSKNAFKNGASRNSYLVFILIIGGITLVSSIIIMYSLGMLKAMGF